MAFEFFRRRQKMVIIIMAVLMVSFLVGAQGLNAVLQKDPAKQTIATTTVGEVKWGEVLNAGSDLQILQLYLQMGNLQRAMEINWPLDREMIALGGSGAAERAYALLLKEARHAGYRAHDQEVDGILQQMGMPKGGQLRRDRVAQMRTRGFGGDDRLLEALGNWLTIHKAYVAAVVDAPPSENELRHLYRDLKERIDLKVATIKATDLLAEMPDPTEQQIQEQFSKNKDVFAGKYSQSNPFGFGYKQPDRVKLLYLFVGGDVVERVTVPSDKAVRDYYRDHRKEFEKAASTEEAASEPAEDAPATQPDQGPRKFSDVKDKIVKTLKSEAVAKRIDDVIARAEVLLSEYAATGQAGTSPYQWVKAAMTKPADEMLAHRIEVVDIQNQRLDEAVASLARLAGLQAICYPYNGSGQSKVDPGVRVSIKAGDISLSDALKEVDRQVKSPEVKWVAFDLFEGVIFPDDDSGLAPLVAGESRMIGRDEALEDDLLANSSTPAGQLVSYMAFMVDRFAEANNTPALVKVNEEGPRMEVAGARPGMLLWRVAEALPARSPESLDDDLRSQVVRDLKTVEALKAAADEAKPLMEQAAKVGLEQAAKDSELDTESTGFFARRRAFMPAELYNLQARMGMIEEVEAHYKTLTSVPVVFGWTDVPGLSLPTPEMRQALAEKAFSLAPANIEPAEGDEPYPVKPYALTTVELPGMKEVLVIQRADYRPIVESEYQKNGRTQLAKALAGVNQWRMRAQWFSLEEVKKRVHYEEKKPS